MWYASVVLAVALLSWRPLRARAGMFSAVARGSNAGGLETLRHGITLIDPATIPGLSDLGDAAPPKDLGEPWRIGRVQIVWSIVGEELKDFKGQLAMVESLI